MLQGYYDILVDGKKDRRLKIRSEITIQDGTSKIEISKDGVVKIYAENQTKLQTFQLVALIAMRSASEWTPFHLSIGQVRDLETGKTVPPELHGELSMSVLAIHDREFVNTAKSLLGLDFEPLQFLMRSTDLLSQYSELSALTALTALELKLNEIVPDKTLWSPRAKLTVLRFVEVLPTEWNERLRKLFTLRNKLAHGNWKSEEIANALSKLLGGNTSDWLTPSHRMNKLASRRVIVEVINALAFLSSVQTKLERIRQIRGQLEAREKL